MELDLRNPNNWQEVWSHSQNAQAKSTLSFRRPYHPIPLIKIPFLLDSRVTAMYADSSSKKTSWNSAGFLYQRFATGLTVGNNIDADFGQGVHVGLDKIKVAIWPLLSPTYELSFLPRPWLTQVSLILWKYTGSISDIDSEQLEALRIDVLRTEKKVDLLFQQQRDL